MHKKAFTLIELLVVIAIIGILAVLVITQLLGAEQKARITATTQNMEQFSQAVSVARLATDETLGQILNSDSTSWCYACSCLEEATYFGNDPSQCAPLWTSAVTAVRAAINSDSLSSGLYGNLDDLKTDSWGTPYLLDQNEGEPYNPNGPCNPDTLRSAGPNRQAVFPEWNLPGATSDERQDYQEDSLDDITVIISLSSACTQSS